MSLAFTDRDGRNISFREWQNLYMHIDYRTIRVTATDQFVVVTEWVGIGNENIFQIRKFCLVTQAECSPPHWTRTQSQALSEHESQVRDARAMEDTLQLPENDPRTTCVLCGAPMQLRQGKFGPFYGCSSWPATGCPCIVDIMGKFSTQTNNLHKQQPRNRRTKSSSHTKLDAIDDRLDGITLE